MAKKKKQSGTPNIIERPPIIVVMGHIDHGKSTLLDYIRKSNVAEGEAGGITQHVSAYEVEHEQDGEEKRITFLDTPGHAAFSAMRSRGAKVADIAILVVAADDGVKEQTLEAYQSIKNSGIPFVVAINKIDKANADVQSTINSLVENEIYLEGYGGEISYTEISAKTGDGIDELLDLILLAAELEELTGDLNTPAEGVIIESNIDPQKGTSATLVIRNGTIRGGMHVAAGSTTAPVRILEDFTGEQIKEAHFSSPVRLTGFSDTPPVGTSFRTYEKRKEAESAAKEEKETEDAATQTATSPSPQKKSGDGYVLPILIKADVAGSLEAIEKEILELENEYATFEIVATGLGTVSEGDVRRLANNENAIVIGFNVDIATSAKDLAEQTGTTLETFTIIYELTKWLEEEIEKRRPRVTVEEIIGRTKVLKLFGNTNTKQVIGCRLLEGVARVDREIKVLRRDAEISTGRITALQRQKTAAEEITGEKEEFGMEIESRFDVAPGDIIEISEKVEK